MANNRVLWPQTVTRSDTGFEGARITRDVSVLQTRSRAHEVRLNAIALEAELRDRSLWTRLRWLLTGRVDG